MGGGASRVLNAAVSAFRDAGATTTPRLGGRPGPTPAGSRHTRCRMPRRRLAAGNEHRDPADPATARGRPGAGPGPLALAGPVPRGHAGVMSSDREARAAVARGGHRRLPPRWFVVAFWYGHRGLLRATRGRFGLWRPKPGRWGDVAAHHDGPTQWEATTGRRRLLRGRSQPGHDGDERLGSGRTRVVAEPAGPSGRHRPDPRRGTTVRARRAQGEERERLWSRWAEIDKNLDDYAARRPTETAVVVLEPRDAAEPGA